MFSQNAWRNLRTAYFVGIALLVLYVFPASREILSFFMDHEVVTGFTVATIVAVWVALGAYLAYIRKL